MSIEKVAAWEVDSDVAAAVLRNKKSEGNWVPNVNEITYKSHQGIFGFEKPLEVIEYLAVSRRLIDHFSKAIEINNDGMAKLKTYGIHTG